MQRIRLAVLALALLLPPLPAVADQAKARKKLDDEYIPFTAEKYFGYVFMADRKMVGLFLEAGMPIDTADDRGTALHRAAEGDDAKLFEMLMKAGANPNAKAKNGDTPLCRAASSGQLKNVQSLLAARAEVNTVCGWGKTALHEAAEKEDAGIVNALLKAGANVEARDEHSETPLAFALKPQKPATLNALVAAGADVNVKWSHGTMPLHEAVNRRNLEGIRILLAAGAQVDGRDGAGQTPLWHAASLDYVEAIPVLLAAGADPDAKDNSKESVKKIAERARSVRAIDLLKDAKKVAVAPVAATGKAAAKPAAAAPSTPEEAKKEIARMGLRMDEETWFKRVDADDARAVALFLKAGFDPATRNDEGRPALWVAIEEGKGSVIAALLEGGARASDPGKASNATYESGDSLVLRAIDRGDPELIRTLIAKGGDPNRANKYGATPLSSAVAAGRADLVQVLLKSGAKVGKQRQNLLLIAKDPAIKKLIKEAA